MGPALQFGSASRRGEPWPGRYRGRAPSVSAEGTGHVLLVSVWDVLIGYAVTALFVAWSLPRPLTARRRVTWSAAGDVVGGGLHMR